MPNTTGHRLQCQGPEPATIRLSVIGTIKDLRVRRTSERELHSPTYGHETKVNRYWKQVPGRSGLVVSTPACGVRGSRFETYRGRLYIAMATAICSLGHGLRLTAMSRPTQPCIPSSSLNRVPTSAGSGKGGNVTSAGWQVTLCNPIWQVSSRRGEAGLFTKDEQLNRVYLFFSVTISS